MSCNLKSFWSCVRQMTSFLKILLKGTKSVWSLGFLAANFLLFSKLFWPRDISQFGPSIKSDITVTKSSDTTTWRLKQNYNVFPSYAITRGHTLKCTWFYHRFEGREDVSQFFHMCKYLSGFNIEIYGEVHSAHEILLDWRLTVIKPIYSLCFCKRAKVQNT